MFKVSNFLSDFFNLVVIICCCNLLHVVCTVNTNMSKLIFWLPFFSNLHKLFLLSLSKQSIVTVKKVSNYSAVSVLSLYTVNAFPQLSIVCCIALNCIRFED
uniref:Uncharacterized protein n=1 Tax=Setaria viridis TaxID=4556 RepID=A0A4U6VYR5_SETVI|nr:hypothetical protein SEVIR_2G354400v2 [Setaria viridis]